jgi:hypothetical protein
LVCHLPSRWYAPHEVFSDAQCPTSSPAPVADLPDPLDPTSTSIGRERTSTSSPINGVRPALRWPQ